MNGLQKLYIILSACNGHDIKKDLDYTELLESSLKLNGFDFKRVLGTYKGVTEPSFLVPYKSNFEKTYLITLAFDHYNQESILENDSHGYTYLLYKDGKTESKGKLVNVSREEAVKSESYSIIDGEYYVTTK